MIRFLYMNIKIIFDWFYGGVRVKVYLRSGNVVTFRAFEAEFDRSGGKIKGYTFKKMNKSRIYFDCEQIECVVIR